MLDNLECVGRNDTQSCESAFVGLDAMVIENQISQMPSLAAFLLLCACGQMPSLVDYRPVVDPDRTNMAKFEVDLSDCRAIAVQVQQDYQKRQGDQMMIEILSGAVAGGIVGNSLGNVQNGGQKGAAIGALVGSQNTDYSYDLVTFGPQRVVDRCMTNRGYRILSDPGRG